MPFSYFSLTLPYDFASALNCITSALASLQSQIATASRTVFPFFRSFPRRRGTCCRLLCTEFVDVERFPDRFLCAPSTLRFPEQQLFPAPCRHGAVLVTGFPRVFCTRGPWNGRRYLITFPAFGTCNSLNDPAPCAQDNRGGARPDLLLRPAAQVSVVAGEWVYQHITTVRISETFLMANRWRWSWLLLNPNLTTGRPRSARLP